MNYWYFKAKGLTTEKNPVLTFSLCGNLHEVNKQSSPEELFAALFSPIHDF